MVQVIEKIVKGDELAARNLGFALADSRGLGLGWRIRRLPRRDRDPPGRRLEFQLIPSFDSGLPPDAPRHYDFRSAFDDSRHTLRLAEPWRLSTQAGFRGISAPWGKTVGECDLSRLPFAFQSLMEQSLDIGLVWQPFPLRNLLRRFDIGDRQPDCGGS